MESNREDKKGSANDNTAATAQAEAGERNVPFPGGRLFMTPGVMEQIDRADVKTALGRHLRGDWGDCCPDDWAENEFALNNQLRLFSVYHDRKGTKFWIITEADRSATTVLLPNEY